MLVAERMLKWRNQNNAAEIAVRVFAPEAIAGGVWACRYEIDWPDGLWVMTAQGADSMQALVLALHMIGSEIYTSSYHKAGELLVETTGHGYGFPVPNSLRDMLVGDDAKFF